MPVRIRHDIHHARLEALLRSPTGGVAKDMLRRGLRVESAAKRLLGGGPGRPRRINTGLLRSSVQARPAIIDGRPGARVGTGLRYARWVHDGTGIYGPRHTKITPKRAKALVFRSKTHGRKSGKFAGKVVVSSVKGMKPNRFLADALPAAKG
jgi:hypothetical protein